MRNVFLSAAFVAASLVPAAAQSPAASPSPLPQASSAASASPLGVPSATPTTLSDFARGRIDTMLRSGHADPAWFSASFLTQVPAAQVDTVLAQIKATLGDYKTIDGTQGDFTAHFAKGTDEVLVHLDAENKMNGLLFRPPKMQTSSLDAALHALQPSRGILSYVVLEGRSERAALDASEPLAVGSAFKLAVLAAVLDGVVRGRRHWSDVVPLEARWRSLPTGVLRTWPDGTPLTLATYATEMISISDNTAADALVRLAGPATLAKYAERDSPFLTTREAFILKSAPGSAQAARFLAAQTPAARASVLRAVDDMPLPAPQALLPQPLLAIEWHFTVRELCDLMSRVADLPLLSINPGVADATQFATVAYKGGSDTGVVNLTTQVTTKRGTRLCVSATLNDRAGPVDETAFESAYGSVLGSLATR